MKNMEAEKNQEKTDRNYLCYFGVRYPVREVDGWHVSTKQFESVLKRDSLFLMEAIDILEGFFYFLDEELFHSLSDEEIYRLINRL